jgi:hypothetical protein
MDMKLNKYIYEKLNDEERNLSSNPITEEEIEMWIFQWYESIYERQPPLWLAGDRWYDRRKRIMKEAEANEEA